MAVAETLGPAARGRRLENFGRLRDSTPDDDLATRLREDGYLLVRGLLDREEVAEGRADLLAQPKLEQTYPMRSDALKRVVHGPRIMAFFDGLFGAPARSYDFIWLRHQAPSLAQDVDTYCENGPNADAVRSGAMRWEHWRDPTDWNGEITEDPHALAAEWGSRWLTTEFRMGDVLIFTLRTVHAGTDNESDALRLSTDTRYQPADQPIDERWIRGEHGEDPIGHGLEAKQGKIC
jgi:hypothetical protein